MSVTVTGDQLSALAYRLGLPLFPGVRSPLLENAGEDRSSMLQTLMSTLQAQGLASDGAESVDVSPDLARVVYPLLAGDTWSLERHTVQDEVTTMLGVLDDDVVVHVADGPLHTLTAAGALVDVLMELVDASEGEPERRASVHYPQSGLLERAPLRDTVRSWRATCTLQRFAASGSSIEQAGVLDGGPGRVWWLILDPSADDALTEDPSLQALPVGPDELAGLLTDWVAGA